MDEIFILALCSYLQKRLEENKYGNILKNKCNSFRMELEKFVGNVFKRQEIKTNSFAASALIKTENSIEFIENLINGITFKEGIPESHDVKCLVTNNPDNFSGYNLVVYDKFQKKYKSNVPGLVFELTAFKYHWQIPEFTLNETNCS